MIKISEDIEIKSSLDCDNELEFLIYDYEGSEISRYLNKKEVAELIQRLNTILSSSNDKCKPPHTGV